MLGNRQALFGYYDWDCVLVGTLVHLIFQGQTDEEHCGPKTIASLNAKWATELVLEQGLPCYKDRKVLATSAVSARKTPTVKSKVTVSPRAASSCSMGRSPVVALDQVADSDDEVPFPGASQCQVVRDSPKKLHADPMCEPTQWLQQ